MPYDVTAEAGVFVQGLHKSFGATKVLTGVDLEVEPGSVTALLGPNGAGKTTMVRILSTLTRPDAGTVRVAGHDVTKDPVAVREVIGLTGQYASIDGLLTGRENLAMMGRLSGLDRARTATRADQLLEQFDLQGAADRRAATYSGGMKRRLDLAVSLMGEPTVVFLDEPTTGLDPRARQATWEVVRSLAVRGATVVLTTQYLEEADQLADRIVVLDDGAVVAEGTAAALKRQVGSDRAHLTLARSQLDAARETLAPFQPLAEEGGIAVGLNGTDQLRGILNSLAAVGIIPDEVSVTRPTLDDVFLSITGKERS